MDLSPPRVQIPPSPPLFMTLKLKNIIFFILASAIYSYVAIDSSLIINHQINEKAILIPDYGKKYFNFKNQFLGKNKKFFIDINFGHITDNCSNIIISPSIKYQKFKFKINLDYLIDNQSSLYGNNWDDAFDFLEKIEYLDLFLFDDKFNLHLGEIKNLNFGHGYLLNNYGNSYNFPIDRDLGFIANWKNSNNSFKYEIFVSSLQDLSNSGGIIGQHVSFLISESFPLRFGLGHVIDLNQFIDHNNLGLKREIHGFEIDFDFPYLNNFLFIGELSGIRFPEKRYYKRVDDDQFTNDKKSRSGTWGLAFPGIKYINPKYEIQLAFNYNSAVHSPYYFNNTYDFEKVRYRQYNIAQNESFYHDEADLLMSFSDSENNLFLPKDMYGMINNYENSYQTYGFSSFIKFNLGSYSKMIVDYSYFSEINNKIDNLSFHTINVNLIGKYNILSFKAEFDLFFAKNFSESSRMLDLEENTMYGAKIDLNIYKKISIFGEYKNTFYDVDFIDGIDKVLYINMGLKLKY